MGPERKEKLLQDLTVISIGLGGKKRGRDLVWADPGREGRKGPEKSQVRVRGTKYHRLRVLNNRNTFLKVLETKKFKIKALERLASF